MVLDGAASRRSAFLRGVSRRRNGAINLKISKMEGITPHVRYESWLRRWGAFG